MNKETNEYLVTGIFFLSNGGITCRSENFSDLKIECREDVLKVINIGYGVMEKAETDRANIVCRAEREHKKKAIIRGYIKGLQVWERTLVGTWVLLEFDKCEDTCRLLGPQCKEEVKTLLLRSPIK